MNGFIRLIKNLCYLSKFDVKTKIMRNRLLNLEYEDILDNFLYYVPNSLTRRPNILNSDDTVNKLVNSDLSITRFGDGEIAIIEGKSIAYQTYDSDLAEKLKNILKNNQNNLLIGINYWYFFCPYNAEEDLLSKHFKFFEMPLYRKNLLKYIDYNKNYCDAGFTCYSYDKDKIYNKLKQIWDKKHILIVTCKNLVDKVEHNIYSNAGKIDYLYVPNKNAYSEYNRILNEIKKYDKDTIIILMCGPTAKVLAYDLAKLKYRALDFGHLLKSYDYSQRNIGLTVENMKSFYSPD